MHKYAYRKKTLKKLLHVILLYPLTKEELQILQMYTRVQEITAQCVVLHPPPHLLQGRPRCADWGAAGGAGPASSIKRITSTLLFFPGNPA